MEREESMGWKIESQSPKKFSLKHREDTKAKTFVSTHLQENQDNYLYTFFLSYFPHPLQTIFSVSHTE